MFRRFNVPTVAPADGSGQPRQVPEATANDYPSGAGPGSDTFLVSRVARATSTCSLERGKATALFKDDYDFGQGVTIANYDVTTQTAVFSCCGETPRAANSTSSSTGRKN